MAEKIRIPLITDFDLALSTYVAFRELRTLDIQRMFGVGSKRATELKRYAKEYAAAHNVPEINAATVDTKTAFAAWHIDVKDIIRRRESMQELGLKEQVLSLQYKQRHSRARKEA